jgi:hypothetical protein
MSHVHNAPVFVFHENAPWSRTFSFLVVLLRSTRLAKRRGLLRLRHANQKEAVHASTSKSSDRGGRLNARRRLAEHRRAFMAHGGARNSLRISHRIPQKVDDTESAHTTELCTYRHPTFSDPKLLAVFHVSSTQKMLLYNSEVRTSSHQNVGRDFSDHQRPQQIILPGYS